MAGGRWRGANGSWGQTWNHNNNRGNSFLAVGGCVWVWAAPTPIHPSSTRPPFSQVPTVSNTHPWATHSSTTACPELPAFALPRQTAGQDALVWL